MKKFDDNTLAELLYDRLQKTIRHPEYMTFCRQQEEHFDNDAFLDPTKLSDTDLLEMDNVQEKFNLSTIVFYNNKLGKEDMLRLPIFTNSMAVLIDWNTESEDEHETRVSCVYNDQYLHVRIDLTAKVTEEQIVAEIKSAIKAGRSTLNSPQKRRHIEKHAQMYKVYDLRYETLPFNEISKRLNISRQTVFSQFRKAWELILEEPYDRKTFTKLLRKYAENTRNWKNIAKLEEAKLQETLFKDNELENTKGISTEKNDEKELFEYLTSFCKSKHCQDPKCATAMIPILIEAIENKEFSEANFKNAEPCQRFCELLLTPGDSKHPHL